MPQIASIVAFVIAGINILAGLLGPIVALPLAIIPLCAGIGILRKRVWSAYGYATVFFAQLLLVPLIFLRPWSSAGGSLRVVFLAIVSLLLGILFLTAGRSLAASGAARGSALPWIVAAALSIAPFFFVQTYKIPSGSMESTLLPGDSILAQTYPLHPPKRGQLVIFLSPEDRSFVVVKRVIAVPGDRIRIAKEAVILNGTALDEKYVTHGAGESDFYSDTFPNESVLPGCAEGHEMLSRQVVNGEVVVPASAYFVLGDNRENSLDSRCYGFVASGDVVGKPLMIYDSVDQPADQVSHPDLRLPRHTRWARLFRVF
ncbi:MAG TPA: signal peptidase I [Terracidiphilus sp.]|nr:signal peptidase I [Terracidiphilus sp.]